MKKILLLVLALLSGPAFADKIDSLNYNSATGQVNAITHQNGTKSVNVAGGASPSSVQSISANYTITNTDGVKTLFVTTSGSTITLTLPAAAANKGRELTVKKSDTGAGKITINRAGSDTIDGATTTDIGTGGFGNNNNQYAYLTLVSDGTTWNVTGVGGELITVASAGGISVLAATANLASVSLGSGRWYVWGFAEVASAGGSATTVTIDSIGVSSTSGTETTPFFQCYLSAYNITGNARTGAVPNFFSFTTATTTYLVYASATAVAGGLTSKTANSNSALYAQRIK